MATSFRMLFCNTFSWSTFISGQSTRWSSSGKLLPRSSPSFQPLTSDAWRSLLSSVSCSSTSRRSAFKRVGRTSYRSQASVVSSREDLSSNTSGFGCNLFIPRKRLDSPAHSDLCGCWMARWSVLSFNRQLSWEQMCLLVHALIAGWDFTPHLMPRFQYIQHTSLAYLSSSSVLPCTGIVLSVGNVWAWLSQENRMPIRCRFFWSSFWWLLVGSVGLHCTSWWSFDSAAALVSLISGCQPLPWSRLRWPWCISVLHSSWAQMCSFLHSPLESTTLHGLP